MPRSFMWRWFFHMHWMRMLWENDPGVSCEASEVLTRLIWSQLSAVTLYYTGVGVDFLIETVHMMWTNRMMSEASLSWQFLQRYLHMLFISPPLHLHHLLPELLSRAPHIHWPQVDHLHHGQLFAGGGQLCRGPCTTRRSDTLGAAFLPSAQGITLVNMMSPALDSVGQL